MFLISPILLHFGRSPHFWFARCSLKFFLSSMSNSLIGLLYPTFHILGLFSVLRIKFTILHFHFSYSLLLRRECCSFSNGEYVKAGLAELEHWCYKATDEVQYYTTINFADLSIMYKYIYILTPRSRQKKIAVCRSSLG